MKLTLQNIVFDSGQKIIYSHFHFLTTWVYGDKPVNMYLLYRRILNNQNCQNLCFLHGQSNYHIQISSQIPDN